MAPSVQFDSNHIFNYAYDHSNLALQVKNMNSAVPAGWDYMALAQTSTVDTYTFRVGGVAGTLLKTIAVTYTDSSKATISFVTVA